METQEPNRKKLNLWGGVFQLLHKLKIKESITRHFIFRPPVPAYNFTRRVVVDGEGGEVETDLKFNFIPDDSKGLYSYPFIKVKPYKIYREKASVLYMTPLLHIKNKRKEFDSVLIFSHGNSCDLGTIYKNAMILSIILRIDVLVYDYTGYGIAPHKPSEQHTYRDLETVMSFALGKLRYKLNKVILCGYSLGSGPTVEMATKFQSIPFIILFAPIASCLSVISKTQGNNKTKYDIFDNKGKMKKVWCDILVIHGKDDQVIPPSHSRDIINEYIESHSQHQNKAWLLEVCDANHQNLIAGLRFGDSEYRTSFWEYYQILLVGNHTRRHELGRERAIIESHRMKIAQYEKEKQLERDRNGIKSITMSKSEGAKVETNWEIEERLSENDSELSDEDQKETKKEILPKKEEKEDKEEKEERDEREEREETPKKKNEVKQFSYKTDRVFLDAASVVKPEFNDRIVKYETEYFLDLYSTLTLNQLPEKWRKIEVPKDEGGNLLFRKALF